MVLILLLSGLTGCANKAVYNTNPTLPDTVEDPKEKKETLTDTVGKKQVVADALGCIFAPSECQKFKKEEPQEDLQDEITEEMMEMDSEAEKTNN